MQESNILLQSSAGLFKVFHFFFSPLQLSLFSSPHHSFHLSLHAVSRRTLSEVRSESECVCRQPWQPCPNWPMAWQDDCQLLSVRAVLADRQQGWTAPDGSFRYKKNSFYSLSLEINFLRNWSFCWSGWVGSITVCSCPFTVCVCLNETLFPWEATAAVI